MWKLGNQGVVVLVSVLSGGVILYSIWGSVLGVTISLILVIYACVLFLANDILPTPHTFIALNYINQTGRYFYDLFNQFSHQINVSIICILEIAKTFYQDQIVTRMDRRRRNTYQLSTESLGNLNRSSEFNIVQGLSPIAKNSRRSYITGSENNSCVSPNSRGNFNTRPLEKTTSTPLMHWNRGNGIANGEARSSSKLSPQHQSRSYLSDHESLREDESVHSQSSSWGTSISPKMRGRAAGVKTVQTVAGPLLASTRYNIDPKVYTDVTSPGLASRLSKYASEANSKLIHQSQYGIGQFPKVNLNSSLTPLINNKSGRVRTPVTVRIAPPEVKKNILPERQKILSDICRAEDKSSPSVVQVLKEISLKRHASQDDVAVELVKKQRTDGIHSEEVENFEEITQKRGRDESSKSEEEISVENPSVRPNKRSKNPSCYDVSSSPSSNTNSSSGVKRKADISRSGSPEVGKHFKAFEQNLRRSLSASPRMNNDSFQVNKELNQSYSDTEQIKNNHIVPSKRLLESVSAQEISSLKNNERQIVATDRERKNSETKNDSVKLTDKLFMRAEPQNIDKLKTLIEGHRDVTAKFSGDGGDEIKKTDVVIMRQTSMKARLRSMFDAISGKGSNKIDPKVVIQAESLNSPEANSTQSSVPTTLNSLTSTTNVNTSPISTSAVVPIIGKIKNSSTSEKHVTFQFAAASTSSQENSVTTTATLSLPNSINSLKKSEEPKISKALESNKPSLPFSSTSMATSNTPIFNTGISMPDNQPSSTSSIITAGSSIVSVASTPSVVSSASQLFNIPASTSSGSGTSLSTTVPKSGASPVISFSSTVQKSTSNIITPPNFSFNNASTASTPQNTTFTVSQSTTKPQFQFNTTVPTTTSTSSTNIFANCNTQFAFPAPSTSAFSFLSTTLSSTQQSQSAVSPQKPPVNSATPVFQFANNNAPSTTGATPAATSSSTFSFGTNSTAAKPGFSFNVGTSPSVASPISSTTSLTLGTPSQTISSAFGPTPAVTSSQTSLFGPASTTTSTLANSTMSNSTSFAFSTSNTLQSAFSLPTTSSFANTNITNPQFGIPKSTETPTFNFNTTSSAPVSTTQAPVFSTPSNFFSQAKLPLFGATTTSSCTTNATPSFASSNTSLFGTQPTTTAGFSTTISTASTSAPLFGNSNVTSAFGSTNLTSTTSFGTSNNALPTFGTTTASTSSFGAASSASLSFGAQNTNSTASTLGSSGPSSAFGVTTTRAPAFSATTTAPPAFGSTVTSPAFGVTTTAPPTFGAATSPAFGSSSTNSSAFGATTAQPAFGASTTAQPAFGASTTTSSLFGSSTTPSAFGASTTTPTAFGSTTAPPPVFGTPSTEPPAFGSATTVASSFGTATSGVFGASGAPPPAFGSTSTSFGSNPTTAVSPFGNQTTNTPAFGASGATNPAFGTPSASTSAFGNPPSSSTSGTFSFGNTSNPPQQQNSLFSFGRPASSTEGTAPFLFGTATTQSGGFNFNGGSNASTSFAGSSSGGMFSIGAGSTTPRSRTTRVRRPQK